MLHAKKKIGAWLVLSTLGLSVLTGCGTQTTVAEAAKVNVLTVKKSSLPVGDTFLGTVAPFVQTSIAPAISGILQDVKARVGDKVVQGQLLATLNLDQLEAQKNQAAAGIQSAQAAKDSAGQSINIRQQNALAALQTGEAGLSSAQTAAQNAQVTAQKALDSANANYSNTQAAYASAIANAQKAIATAQAQVTKAQSGTTNGVSQAQSAVSAAQSQLQAAQSKTAASLAVSQQNVDKAQDAMTTAQTKLTRAQQMAHSTTDPDLLDAQAAYSGAAIGYQNALGALQYAQADKSVDVAQAAVNSAQSALQTAQSGNDVTVAQAALDQAKQALQAANDSKVVQVAQAAVAQAQNALTAAASQGEAAVNTAQAQLGQAQTAYQTSLTDPSLVVSDAQIQAAQASVQVVQANIDKGQITAPIGGYVVAVNAQVGQAVGPQGGFIVISSTDPLMATVDVPESSIALIQKGMPMDVYVSSTKDRVEGTVNAIHQSLDAANTAADNANTNYPVDITLNKADATILSGMRVEAYAVDHSREAILIPASSVVDQQGDKADVFVVTNGVAKRVAVKLVGLTNTQSLDGADNIVLSGLNEGDKVVVQGQNHLNDGDKVNLGS
ncbi:MAG: efflux RND transporter periplasmic adaptor subunit [Desulfosporosinus sp.]|nr:efflux RND transporter periplasmic adaptor subunit [Desulfosporosinus sp.]